jgi:hypothetical protein
MTTRCAFFPSMSGDFFLEKLIEFKYENGLSASQRFKSAGNLRLAAVEQFPSQNGLEVSRYSDNPLGVNLSAFNLKINLPNLGPVAIENVFQSSKVFENGGPYSDLLRTTPFDAKRDSRLKSSGALLEFRFETQVWPLSSGTDFYDYYYITALSQNYELLNNLLTYDYFTDIACNKTGLGFQKGKTFSTQARSCAIAVSLQRAGKLEEALESQANYWKVLGRTSFTPNSSQSEHPTLF